MIRVHQFACRIPGPLADSLNRESGRIYTQTMVTHWRVIRQSDHWLSQYDAMRLNDYLTGETILHAHSRDAAQEGFYKACKTITALRKAGDPEARYPYRGKYYRTTIWKSTGMRKKGHALILSLARGHDPIVVKIPQPFRHLDEKAFKQMSLVYDKAKRRYRWHLTIDDGKEPEQATSGIVASIDMGEIHPVTIGIEGEAAVITCRELRSNAQYRNKRMASIETQLSKYQRGSRRWRRLKARKNRFLAKMENRQRDMLHKVSRASVDWCIEYDVSRIHIGDVRDIADSTKKEKRLRRPERQKISNWPHGKMRNYIAYKAAEVGIAVEDKATEHYTSQTCPSCGNRKKPKGRTYKCSKCDFVGHRDVVGQVNILSLNEHGQFGQVEFPQSIKYLRPYNVRRSSPIDTGHVAWSSSLQLPLFQESPRL